MKNYYVLLSLNKNKKRLDQIVLRKKLTSKVVVKLSQKIDRLQNKLYYT